MKQSSSVPRGSKSRGAAAVEFAIIAPVFILILLFMVDAGRILFIESSLLNAASQAARAEAIGMSDPQVIAAAQNSAPGVLSMAGAGELSVTVTVNTQCPATLTAGTVQLDKVTTSVNYAWTTPVGFLQHFNPSQTRPGTTAITASSQWTCN